MREVENIEILDFSASLDMDRVRGYLKLIEEGRKRLYGGTASATDPLCEALLSELNFMVSTFPFLAGSEHSNFWKIDPNAPLGLDRFILGDFFELDQRYDFLLSATTMQHFSVPAFLRKAYSLLEPGGVLFIWNAYWYWVLIVIRVYGDFPWALQRLTWDDFVRYLREYQPDQVDNARRSVETFHKAEKRYTLADYIAAGEAAGFRQVDHHRLVPFSGIQNQIGEWCLEGDHGATAQQEALRDIHCFAPDVELIDLSTQSIFLLLQKD